MNDSNDSKLPAIVDGQLNDQDLMAQLAMADFMIRRTYLADMKRCDVVPFSETGLSQAGADTVRVRMITRIVYDKRESTLDNLLNIYSALGSNGYGVALIVKSDGSTIRLCLGVRTNGSPDKPASSGARILEGAINGHLPGSKTEGLLHPDVYFSPDEEFTSEDVAAMRNDVLMDIDGFTVRHPEWAISAMIGIPSLKTETREDFTQGLERFLDAMQGQCYTAVFLADPVSPAQSVAIERGLETLASTFSALSKLSISRGVNQSVSTSESLSEGVTETISKSVALSQSHTEGSSVSTTRNPGAAVAAALTVAGGVVGAVVTAPVGLPLGPLGVPVAAKVGAMIGMSVGAQVGNAVSGIIGSKTKGTNTSDTDGRTDTDGTSIGKSLNIIKGLTEQLGTSETLGYEVQNKAANRLLERIDQQLKRLDEARAYGLWNASCYFLCDSTEQAETAASFFSGCMRGEKSGVEDSAIVVWGKPLDAEDDGRERVREYVVNLTHPRLRLQGCQADTPWVCPSALVSGKELALLLHLPRRSVGGVTVVETTGFGRDVHYLKIGRQDECVDFATGDKDDSRRVALGCVRHMFRDEPAKVSLHLDRMVYHTLVTGTTGVGKTTGVTGLLKKCHEQGVPFLVVEPAKDEYNALVGLSTEARPVRRFQAGRCGPDCLRLNPLVFPEGAAVSLIEHIDRVCALFNAAFPMYAAMPQLLEEAIVRAYEARGWDTLTSKCRGAKRSFPTLREVADLVPHIVEGAGYRQEAQSTYVGALTTRLKSLMRGVLGSTFMAQEAEETPATELFDECCIVNVSQVGSTEKRALLMGLLMIRLQEYRIVQQVNRPRCADRLQHLMVVEEAHNILKRTTQVGNMESANSQGQAVEYFANALAEMRAFGQGFVIVDQSASALDDAVLRNTNTKIAFRAPFETDRHILGGAFALDERQIKALAALENHTALIKQNDWLEAVLCHFDKPNLPASANSGTDNLIRGLEPDVDAACFCAVLFALFDERITFPHPPGFKMPSKTAQRSWLERHIGHPAMRDKIHAQITHPRRLDLKSDLAAFIRAIAPLQKMLRDAELCAASADGVINHLWTSLHAMTGIDDERSLWSCTHQCLRSASESEVLSEAARWIEHQNEKGSI